MSAPFLCPMVLWLLTVRVNVTPKPSFRYNSRLFFGGQSACNLFRVLIRE
ncbi:hypothetical protein SAMN03159444_04109 [Pseudomonas sp. NFACC02]|nr:hypothetical protein SAMN03159444_04109 [Pseudomonas sp. NFACC02]